MIAVCYQNRKPPASEDICSYLEDRTPRRPDDANSGRSLSRGVMSSGRKRKIPCSGGLNCHNIVDVHGVDGALPNSFLPYSNQSAPAGF